MIAPATASAERDPADGARDAAAQGADPCFAVGVSKVGTGTVTSNPAGIGGPGNDALVGGRGTDLLDGGRGADSLLGGTGADAFYARDGVREIVNGGVGRDRARVDRFDVRRSIERRF